MTGTPFSLIAAGLPPFAINGSQTSGGGSGGGGSGPLTVSGLLAWWDFTDNSTITYNTDSSVNTVSDKSGNGHTASSPGGGSPNPANPAIAALCPNGDQALDFTTGAQYLQTSNLFTASQPLTVICVGKNTNTSTADSAFVSNQSGTTWFTMVFGAAANLTGGPGNYLIGFAGSEPGSGDTTVIDRSRDIIATYIANGASSKMFINGTQRGTTGSDTGTNGLATGLYIGRLIGTLFGDSNFQGYIAHVLVYSGALSDTDRQGLDTWLAADTGITF